MKFLTSLLVVSVAVIMLAGCDSSPTTFNHVNKVEDFPPEVQEVVVKTINQKFGQPAQLIVDEAYPITFNPSQAKVVSISEDRKSFTVDLSETSLEWKIFAKGQQVLFPGMKFEPKEDGQVHGPFLIESASVSNKTFVLNQALPAEVVVDTKSLLDATRSMRKGQSLYMQHCVHCHGATGDGKGASAKAMDPRPRDFTLGKIKYTSTGATERASNNDLDRILKEGVAGTYMPSFRLLNKDERTAIINYVKFLGTRGELEGKLCGVLELDYSSKSFKERIEGKESKEDILKEFKEFEKNDLQSEIASQLEGIKGDWERANMPEVEVIPTVQRPEPYDKSLADPSVTSVENGYKLYLSKKAQCTACHGESGRGDGFQTRDIQKDPQGNPYPRPGLHDDWGNFTPPRDLTKGVMRGGRRPVDLFRRIYAGIKGTRMLAFGGTGLKDEEIWDVVNYILLMPELKGQVPTGKEIKPEATDSQKVSKSP